DDQGLLYALESLQDADDGAFRYAKLPDLQFDVTDQKAASSTAWVVLARHPEVALWTERETAKVLARVHGDGSLELLQPAASLILTSPNGSRFGVSVSNAGAVVVAPL